MHGEALRVFLDCERCDRDFLRTEVGFVGYVRDRSEAQVHVLVTTQSTGAGGTEYTATFIGLREFGAHQDTLRYVAEPGATDDVVRKGLAHILKLGLVRYAAHTPLARRIGISYGAPAQVTVPTDRWNQWVYEIEANGNFNGESSRRFLNAWGSVEARRVTRDTKLGAGLNANYSESRFETGSRDIASFSRGQGAEAFAVLGLGEHWSWGTRFNAWSSSYSNIEAAALWEWGLEYNVFPYSQSTRRQLRCDYIVRPQVVDYVEETVYFKSREFLARHALEVALKSREPWGSTELRVEASHYLHDFARNRVELSAEASLRVVAGLSVNLSGNVSRVRDQLSLQRAGATVDEILLQRRQLASNYFYWASLGLEYTFGSIYSSVVNARFGD